MTTEAYQQQAKLIEDFQTCFPGIKPFKTLAELNTEKLRSEMDDSNWEQWYDHFHRLVIQKMEHHDAEYRIRVGINFSLETTSLYLLLSAIFIPAARHWWLILPSFIWMALLIGESINSVKKFSNRWMTLYEQIDYLYKLAERKGKIDKLGNLSSQSST